MISSLLAELFGTMMLILLGGGVVANVVLNRSKGQNSGWIVITAGWAFGVTAAAYCFGSVSGGHFNPAVTIALACIGEFSPLMVPLYIAAQVLGAFLGALLVWLAYQPHWAATTDAGAKLGVFCTSPAIRSDKHNLVTEMIGTALLMFGALRIGTGLPSVGGWSLGIGPAQVGLLVWAIGVSLGGPTGYAINPARDFGPRLAHHFLPIPGKGSSEWDYAWVPIVGPIAGAIIGAVLHRILVHLI